MILHRYVGRQVAVTLVGVLLAALVVVLGIEFADRARVYSGEGWLRAVAELYACRAAVMSWQLAPAAVLIAVEIAVAALKRRGELTAMRSLGVSPAVILVPCGVVGAVVALAMFAADESVVGAAGRRVDEINARRFHSWGDWDAWFGQRRWFRSGRTVYFLREVAPDGAYAGASIFELSDDFRLRRRLDAERLSPGPDGRWRVQGGVLRSFESEGRSSVTTMADDVVLLAEPSRSFAVRTGRPEQLRLGELAKEMSLRQEVGLVATPYALALHNKLVHPLTALPLAVGGAAIALRPRRRDATAVAMVEGLGAVALLWALMVVLRAATVGGWLPAWMPAWSLLAMASAAAAAFAWRASRTL